MERSCWRTSLVCGNRVEPRHNTPADMEEVRDESLNCAIHAEATYHRNPGGRYRTSRGTWARPTLSGPGCSSSSRRGSLIKLIYLFVCKSKEKTRKIFSRTKLIRGKQGALCNLARK